MAAVGDRRGLVLDWPSGAAPADYPGWVNDTRTAVPLRFVRQDRHHVCRTVATSPVPCTDLGVFVYESNVDPTAVADRSTLAALPGSLPAATLSGLAADLLPAESRKQLDAATAALAGPVPVDYAYQATAAYWVEPGTGAVVRAEHREIRTMRPRLPGHPDLPAIVVYDVALTMACTRYNCAAVDAWDALDRRRLRYTTVPAVLAVTGAIGVAAAVGTAVRRRRRRRPGPATRRRACAAGP